MDDFELEGALKLLETCSELTSSEIEYIKSNAVDCYTDFECDDLLEYHIMGNVNEICCFNVDSDTGLVDLLEFNEE